MPGTGALYGEAKQAIERQPAPAPHGGQTARYGGDVQRLIQRCAFIRYCRDKAATLSEPLWYAMTSNVARCTDGPPAVHQLSTPYPGYLVEETDAKIQHALADAGPHRCETIRTLGFSGCPPWGCGVKTPAALAWRGARQTRPRTGGLCTIPAGEVTRWRS